MTKTIDSNFKTHLAGEVTTVATCWKITREDGEIFRFTDHDVDIVVAGETYEAASGMLPMGLDQSGGLAVDNMDVIAFLDSDKITEADIQAGLFDYAIVDIFIINYAEPFGPWTDGTFGNETADTNNVAFGYGAGMGSNPGGCQVELGHFDISLAEDIPGAGSVTKVYIYCGRASYVYGVYLRFAIYNADDDDPANWTLEGYSSEKLFPLPALNWYELEVNIPFSAGKKVLAVIPGHDLDPGLARACNMYYTIKASAADHVVMGSPWKTPLGAIQTGACYDNDNHHWCMYADITYREAANPLYLAKGWTLGNIEIKDGSFQCEIRGKTQHLDQKLCQIFTPDCRADLGDSQCGVDLADSGETFWHAGAVNSQSGDRKTFIDTSVPSSVYEDVFTGGLLTWVEPESGDSFNGDNATYSMEVKSFDSDTGEFELFDAMPYDIEVGDEFTVTWGCNKTIDHCYNRFDNINNFRGEPHIPGWDTVIHVRKP